MRLGFKFFCSLPTRMAASSQALRRGPQRARVASMSPARDVSADADGLGDTELRGVVRECLLGPARIARIAGIVAGFTISAAAVDK
jgi:hypothetical protein